MPAGIILIVEPHLANRLSSGRRSSPHTAEAYRRDLLDFLAFTGHRLADNITAADVAADQALLRQKYQPASEYRKLAAVRSFFKFLKASRVIAENPAGNIEGPRTESQFTEKVLTEEEVLAMIEAARGTPADSLLLRLLCVLPVKWREVGRIFCIDLGGPARLA